MARGMASHGQPKDLAAMGSGSGSALSAADTAALGMMF